MERIHAGEIRGMIKVFYEVIPTLKDLSARFWVPFLILLGLIPSQGACSRRFYRERADRDVEQILAEKDQYPEWSLGEHSVYPDPRSRFADDTNPDRPPMPPDDPASEELSPNPQRPGKAGVALIEGNGYRKLLEFWNQQNRRSIFPPGNDSSAMAPYLITLDQSCELGLINSREYQDRREDLYLAALPVTVERFAFAAQFFATEQAIREATGRNTPEGQNNRFRYNSNIGFSKLFPSGALLLVRLANQTIINLTGSHPHSPSQSIFTLDVFQPLLRGGGWAVTLEPLTQAERSLLYEVRNYSRFREEFYAFLAAGNSFGRIVRGSGSRAIPSSSIFDLSSNEGTLFVSPGAGARAGLSGAFGAPATGFLPTLLLKAELIDERASVAKLEEIFKLFQAYKEGGDISQLQVDQVEQQLLQSRSTVLLRDQDHRDAMDRFKLQLGLPTDLNLDLEDQPYRPIQGQLARFDQIIDEFKQAREAIEEFDPQKPTLDQALAAVAGWLSAPLTPPAPAGAAANLAVTRVMVPAILISNRLREQCRKIASTSNLVKATRFQQQILERWAVWEKLSDANDGVTKRLNALRAERRDLLDRKAERTLNETENARLAEIEFEIDLGAFEKSLRNLADELGRPRPDLERRRRAYAASLRDAISAFAIVLSEARNERIDALRPQWPDLPPVKVAEKDLITCELDQALTASGQAALTNRLDLMNERARLVDSWRQIKVLANSLMGTLNVEYHWDSFTPPSISRPLTLGGSGNRHQLVVNGELPLVRTVEQANYRTGLIAFQRQRRELMEAEDDVLAAVRQEIRQLRQLAENYRIQQRAVELAYLQLENALEVFRSPPVPTASDSASAANAAANAAALTQQVLNAQRSLPAAQNQIYLVWINYHTTRIQLLRDLELLPLDQRGVWIDELATLSGRNPP